MCEEEPVGLLYPWNFPGKNTGVGSSSPGNLSNRGMEPRSPALQADSLPSEPPGKPLNKQNIYVLYMYVCIYI